jgi:predicted transcriptional regulator
MTDDDSRSLFFLTADIVSAHISNNAVPEKDLPQLIQQVYAALSGVTAEPAQAPKRQEPAVAVKKSVDPDFIVCLEDGQKLKMLKRHLLASHNMTPEDYLERWDLPADYPMVAPNYARRRSELAKDIGLGTRKRLPD